METVYIIREGRVESIDRDEIPGYAIQPKPILWAFTGLPRTDA
jgi:hypothetical protein